MTARVCYTADALYPEYKTACLETFGEDMTNQKRRMEDKLPTEPLKWDEDSANDEILKLHRQLAAEKLRADRAESRADAKSQECIELRERMAARQGGITSEENGAGELTDEQIFEIWDHAWDAKPVSLRLNFARAIARAAIAAHLARQPKAEQPVIKTWQERMVVDHPDLADNLDGCIAWEVGNPYKDEEIDDLRAALARRAQAGPLRYTSDGALAECPCCGSLDVGGAHNTVHCYACDLTIKRVGPLQNAIDAWNRRAKAAPVAPASAQNAEQNSVQAVFMRQSSVFGPWVECDPSHPDAVRFAASTANTVSKSASAQNAEYKLKLDAVEVALGDHFDAEAGHAMSVLRVVRDLNAPSAERVACQECKGTGGRKMAGDCTDCNGKGYGWEPSDGAQNAEAIRNQAADVLLTDTALLDGLDKWRAAEARRGFHWSSIHIDMGKPVRGQLAEAVRKALQSGTATTKTGDAE